MIYLNGNSLSDIEFRFDRVKSTWMILIWNDDHTGSDVLEFESHAQFDTFYRGIRSMLLRIMHSKSIPGIRCVDDSVVGYLMDHKRKYCRPGDE